MINRQLRNSYEDISQVVAFYIGQYNPLGEEVDLIIGPIGTDSNWPNLNRTVSRSRYILIGFKPDHLVFGHRLACCILDHFRFQIMVPYHNRVIMHFGIDICGSSGGLSRFYYVLSCYSFV